MAREIKFVTRVDNSKIAQDTEQTRRLILAAYAPVQFEAPNVQPQQVRAATINAPDGRLEKEQQLLDVAKLRADTEKQKNEIAISSLTQQVQLANQVAEIRLNGERAAARIAEERRQKELLAARSAGDDTTQLEIQHARQRQEEERKILALTNEVSRTRLQGELRIEQAASRSAIARLQAESRVAAAAEKTARAQLEAAQAATGKATNDQERIAAENRVAEAVEKVTQAQRQREGVTQQLAAEQISAERRVADIAEKAAADRVQAENKVQAAKRETAKVTTTGAGNSGVTNLLSGVNRAANLLTGGLQAFAAVQLVRQINNTANELDRLRVEATRSKVSLDILSGSSSNAAARIAAIQQAGNGTINTLAATNIAVQATALGLANTTGEFERLTTAARAVSLVSPIIRDVNSAISEISLAGANQSFRRLDQLGLGVQEVKDKIAELQAADKSLSDQQAFSAAVIDTLNSKYGSLLKTTEAQASGQERLTTAFADFRTELANSGFIKGYDNLLGELADSFERLRALTSEDIRFFGSLAGVDAELASLTLGINEADSTWTKFKKAFAGDLETPFVESPFKKENLEAVRPLFSEIKKLQDSGAISADEYNSRLRLLAATLRTNKDAAKNFAPEIFELSRQIEAAAQILDDSTESGRIYAEAQKLLGNGFISTSEDAQKLVVKLSDIQANINQDGALPVYISQLNNTQKAFVALTGEAEKYNKAAEAKKRVELIGDAEKNFGQFAADQATQLIESGASYDEALAVLNDKKAKIQEFFDNFPTDIKPEEIPLVLAKFKVELDTDPLATAKAAIEEQRNTLTGIVNTQAESLIESGKSVDEAIAYQNTQIAKVNEFVDSLATQNLTPEEITLRVVQYKVENFGDAAANPVADAEKELREQIRSQITDLVAQGLSREDALELIKEYGRNIGSLFAGIPDNIDPTELDLRIAQYQKVLDDRLAELTNSLNLSDINPEFALDDIVFALSQLDTSAVTATPGLSSLREELIALYDEIQRTGEVTTEQAARLAELEGVAFAVGQTTGIYANQVNDLGDSFFDTHAEAGELFAAIAELEGKYVNGQVPIDQYKGAMSSLIDRLILLAEQAGITGKELEDLIGLKTELDTTGSSLGVGFQEGRSAGTQQAELIRLQTAEQTQREAERAAKEWERAGKEAENAAKRAQQAFQSQLEKVPGLFGSSGVTQEQLDLAAAGIPQNFADDFVRRLEDLLKNGVQRPGVTFDRAREALNNINIQTEGLTNEQVFALIKKTFADSSLFANDANLDLINVDAVKASLDLQNKQEQGKQNIVDYLSKVYDVNLAALTGGDVKAGAEAGAVPPSAAQQAALAQQQNAQVALSLQVDDKAIDAAATKSAQLFEKVFSDYDFSAMAAAPANAMAVSLATEATAAAYRQVGIKAADFVRDAFTGRVSEADWLKSLRDAFYNDLVGDATSAVLSALS